MSFNVNDNLNEREMRDAWNADSSEVDFIAEVDEGIYNLLRQGLIEIVPGTDPPAYRLVGGDDGGITLD